MRTLTKEQEETIFNIEQNVLTQFDGYENLIEINATDCVLEAVTFHSIFITIPATGLSHSFGFWILPDGDILKIAQDPTTTHKNKK